MDIRGTLIKIKRLYMHQGCITEFFVSKTWTWHSAFRFCRRNLNGAFSDSNKLQTFSSSGKNKTSPIQGSGCYRIPCSCSYFYIGRIQRQLGERLLEYRSSIDRAMKLHQRSKNSDSALAQHVCDNQHPLILFENASIISFVKGLLQVSGESVEIKKYMYQTLAHNTMK